MYTYMCVGVCDRKLNPFYLFIFLAYICMFISILIYCICIKSTRRWIIDGVSLVISCNINLRISHIISLFIHQNLFLIFYFWNCQRKASQCYRHSLVPLVGLHLGHLFNFGCLKTVSGLTNCVCTNTLHSSVCVVYAKSGCQGIYTLLVLYSL